MSQVCLYDMLNMYFGFLKILSLDCVNDFFGELVNSYFSECYSFS